MTKKVATSDLDRAVFILEHAPISSYVRHWTLVGFILGVSLVLFFADHGYALKDSSNILLSVFVLAIIFGAAVGYALGRRAHRWSNEVIREKSLEIDAFP